MAALEILDEQCIIEADSAEKESEQGMSRAAGENQKNKSSRMRKRDW